MEEMRKTAVAYYKNLPEDEKKGVKEFFEAIDGNGDGYITMYEYTTILGGKLNNTERELFEAIDKDGNGRLDFEEAITLYYMCITGRVIRCDGGCMSLVKGDYFTCVQCFYNSNRNSFDLCCNCYNRQIFVHHKDAVFLDNVALLLQSRKVLAEAPAESKDGTLTTIQTMSDIASISSASTTTSRNAKFTERANRVREFCNEVAQSVNDPDKLELLTSVADVAASCNIM